MEQYEGWLWGLMPQLKFKNKRRFGQLMAVLFVPEEGWFWGLMKLCPN